MARAAAAARAAVEQPDLHRERERDQREREREEKGTTLQPKETVVHTEGTRFRNGQYNVVHAQL